MTTAPRPPRTTLPALHAALRLLLPLLAALAGALLPPPALATRAPAEVAASAPAWWAAFDDPLLRELLARTNARPGLLLRGYVELRMAMLRAGIAEQLHTLSAQRLAAVRRRPVADPGPSGSALAEAQRRAQHFAQVFRAADVDADHRLGMLALLLGLDDPTLRRRLADRDGLPQVQAALPGAEPRPLRQDDPQGVEREWARQAVLDAAGRAQRSQSLLQAAQLQCDAARLRLRTQGSADPALDDTLADALTAWLLQAAQAVDDAGALALAWSQWLQAGGAAGTVAAPSPPA